MVRASRVLSFSATTVLILFVATAAEAAVTGRFSGTVKDRSGMPLVGAVVTLLEPETDSDNRVRKQVATNKKGRFVATNLAPGRYSVRVMAQGFAQSRLNTLEIKPGAEVNYDFLMRRENRLVDARANEDFQYEVRRTRRHTLQLEGKEEDGLAVIAATFGAEEEESSRRPVLEHGFVQFYTEAAPSAGKLGVPAVGVNFALTHRFSDNVETVFWGRGGQPGLSQRLEALTSVQVNEQHKLQVSLGYGRLPLSFTKAGLTKDHSPLEQISLRVTDAWRIKGPAILIFGFDYAHFNGPASSHVILPRLGFQFNATPKTKLVAELTPGSSSKVEEVVGFENQQIVFTEPTLTPVVDGRVQPDRSRRMQVSVEHLLSKNSSVEATVFYDTISGHGVGLLAIPADSTVEAAAPQVAAQYGTSRGTRIVYTKRFNRSITGAIGYSVGQGQRLSAEGINQPARLFDNDLFQVAVAKVDVDLNTGTRVSTTFRFAPHGVVFAIDPFQGRTLSFDPNISIFVAQPLPSLSLLPGRWEASLNVLNLLDQQGEVENEFGRLLLGRSHRVIRGGVSVRF